ncbi:hypothetical protein D3C71_1744460 [compost metagenome]
MSLGLDWNHKILDSCFKKALVVIGCTKPEVISEYRDSIFLGQNNRGEACSAAHIENPHTRCKLHLVAQQLEQAKGIRAHNIFTVRLFFKILNKFVDQAAVFFFKPKCSHYSFSLFVPAKVKKGHRVDPISFMPFTGLVKTHLSYSHNALHMAHPFR